MKPYLTNPILNDSLLFHSLFQYILKHIEYKIQRAQKWTKESLALRGSKQRQYKSLSLITKVWIKSSSSSLGQFWLSADIVTDKELSARWTNQIVPVFKIPQSSRGGSSQSGKRSEKSDRKKMRRLQRMVWGQRAEEGVFLKRQWWGKIPDMITFKQPDTWGKERRGNALQRKLKVQRYKVGQSLAHTRN